MAPNKQKYPSPVPGLRSQTTYRILEPTKGINRSQPPQHLQPTESWELQNFEYEGASIRPRSGLSKHATIPTAYNSNWLLAERFRTAFNAEVGVMISLRTTAYYNFNGANSSWSTCDAELRRLASSNSTTNYTSNTTNDYYSSVAAHFRSSLDSSFISTLAGDGEAAFLIAVNGKNSVIFASGVTDDANFADTADYYYNYLVGQGFPLRAPKFITQVDERLVIFSDVTNPTMLGWSSRGDIWNYKSTGGADAGYQRLEGLEGTATGLARDPKQSLVIFTDAMIWEGVPRRDVFAFDFKALQTDGGCPYPRTVKETPLGVMFVGSDFRVYAVAQGQIRVVCDKTRQLLQRSLMGLSDIHAEYHHEQRQYIIFYADAASAYPQGALVVQTDVEGGALTLWRTDASAPKWQASMVLDEASNVTTRDRVGIAASDGSFYRMLSSQTRDHTHLIDYRWTPAALNPGYNFSAPVELWIEHQSNVTSTLTVTYSTDMSDTAVIAAGVLTLERNTHIDSPDLIGTSTAYLPLSLPAARHPQLKFQLETGRAASNDVRISRVEILLRRYSGRH